jgi:hypothetical protein
MVLPVRFRRAALGHSVRRPTAAITGIKKKREANLKGLVSAFSVGILGESECLFRRRQKKE